MRKPPFRFSLCRHSKQAGDERHLPSDIPFAHTSDLSLPDHVHDLISLQGSPCRFQGKEAHSRLDQPFEKAMVLFDQVIQVFDLSEFDLLGKDSSGFELCHGFGIGGMLVDIDHTRSRQRGVGIPPQPWALPPAPRPDAPQEPNQPWSVAL